jgi:hypothetical protein
MRLGIDTAPRGGLERRQLTAEEMNGCAACMCVCMYVRMYICDDQGKAYCTLLTLRLRTRVHVCACAFVEFCEP